MLGIELVPDNTADGESEDLVAERLMDLFRQQGLILRPNGRKINLYPPICTTRDEADEIVAGLDLALGIFETGSL